MKYTCEAKVLQQSSVTALVPGESAAIIHTMRNNRHGERNSSVDE